MLRSPKSDNSGDEIADDSFESDDQDKVKIPAPEAHASPLNTSRRLGTQPTAMSSSAHGGLGSLQLFRTDSIPSRRPVMGDSRANKTQSLEVLTEMVAIDLPDATIVAGFDPRRWIYAAGVLEKRRDGLMREGWAKRFFVLGKNSLYYFLLPKTDGTGYAPLLGDERGYIKLTDIQEVNFHARDSNYWYLNIEVAAVRKNTPAQYFNKNNQISQVQVRTPAESGQLWLDALVKARDEAKSAAAASGSPKSTSSLRKSQNRDGDSQSQVDVDVPLKSPTASQAPTPSQPKVVEAPPPLLRSRRDSANIRALDLVPLDTSFPLAKPAPILPLFLALLLLFIAAYPKSFKLEDRSPEWLLNIPSSAFGGLASVFLVIYYTISKRAASHDAVAREARLRVGVMRDELNEFKKAHLSELTENEKVLLPVTSSEIARIQEECLSVRHAAGSSTKFSSDLRPGVHYMCWGNALGANFRLRVGPNYKKNNLKAPSADSLYEVVALDLFATKDRLSAVGRSDKVDLPPYRPGVDPSMDDLRAAGLPRLFIVNAQIPEKYSLVFYFSIKASTVAQALGPNPHPSIKLLKQYVKEHATNPDIRRRFKAIGIADNVKDLGISNMFGVRSLIDKFNGKPVIINKVAQIYESENSLDWFEVDISIFDFPFTAKSALSALKDRVSEVLMRAGFTIQGELDEELPECLLGGADMCGLDFRLAKVI